MEGFRIGFACSDTAEVSAQDLSSLLYDINRIYVTSFHFITDSPKLYSNGLNRHRFDLPEESRLKIGRIRFESPLIFELAAAFGAAGGALLATVQLVRMLHLWPLEAEKLELEIEKLKREARQSDTTPLSPDRLRQLSNHPQIYGATGQLQRNPIQPNQVGRGFDRRV